MIQDVLDKSIKPTTVEQIIKAYKRGRRDFSSTNLSPSSKFVDVTLSGASFDASYLTDTTFKNCDLSNCFFQDVLCEEGKLRFVGCKLENAHIMVFGDPHEPTKVLFKYCNMKNISLRQKGGVQYILEDCEMKFS